LLYAILGGGGGGVYDADDDIYDAAAAVAVFRPHQRTAVDDLTAEFRKKASIPGALTKPLTTPKQKVYLAEDSTAEEINCWLKMKGFSCRF